MYFYYIFPIYNFHTRNSSIVFVSVPIMQTTGDVNVISFWWKTKIGWIILSEGNYLYITTPQGIIFLLFFITFQYENWCQGRISFCRSLWITTMSFFHFILIQFALLGTCYFVWAVTIKKHTIARQLYIYL